MASLSVLQLKEYIAEILRGADLNSLSSKRVRQLLEEKLGTDLSERKKEIDDIVMEMITSSQSEGTGESSDDLRGKKRVENGKSDDSETDEDSPAKRVKYEGGMAKAKGKKLTKVASRADTRESGSSEEDELDDEMLARKIQEEEIKGRTRAVKKQTTKKGSQQQAAPVKRKKESTYSRKCRLSPELAAVVGANELARHDVVKKMWEIVKGRNLYDPKNKQFAICDDQLMTVFGVRRFRTFGMMKYLKAHITDIR